MRGCDISSIARRKMVQKAMPPPTDTARLMLTERAPRGSLSRMFTGIKGIKYLYQIGRKTVNCPEILANIKRELKILK